MLIAPRRPRLITTAITVFRPDGNGGTPHRPGLRSQHSMSPRSDPTLGSPASGKGAEPLSRVKEETSSVICVDNSVVIAGLGLRLAPQPTESVRAACHSKSPDEGRVFVTELVNGGAAQRSNLLKQNDEILHVDHVQTKLRTVVYIPPSSQPAPACLAAALSRHSGVDLF